MKIIKIKTLYFSILFLSFIQNLNAVYLGHIDQDDGGSTMRRVFVDFSKQKSDVVFKTQVLTDQLKKDATDTEEISKVLINKVKESIGSTKPKISQTTINFVNINERSHFDRIDEIVASLVSKKPNENCLKGILLSVFSDPSALRSIQLSVHDKDEEITSKLK